MNSNKAKKLFTGILAAAMMSVCIPATVSQAAASGDENGIYVLKWGDNVGKMTGNFDFYGAEDGSFIRIDTTKTGDDPQTESTISYGFNYTGEETTGYDVWVLATIHKDNAVSRPYISFDTDEGTKIEDTFDDWVNAGQTAATVDEDGVVSPRNYVLAGTNFPLNWCKVAENVMFTPGEHRLNYTVYPTKDPDTNKDRVLTCYGGAILVPSSYNWVPTSKTDVKQSGSTYEKSFDHSYAWIELEDYNTKEGEGNTKFIDKTNPDFSDRGILRMYGIANEQTYTYDFTLDSSDSELENNGSYDIWYLGNEKVSHLSWFDYGIDVSDTDPLTAAGDLEKSETVYTYNLEGDRAIQWHKVAANVNISSGHHVLTFKEKFRTLDNNLLYGISDCIAIVPSSAGWTPGANDKSDQARVNLDAHMIPYALEKLPVIKNAEEITQMGAAGSRYTYKSENQNIIENDLTLHKKYFETRDCNLTATAVMNDASATAARAATVTIFRSKPYVIKNLKITNEQGAEIAQREAITESLANGTIKASATIYDDISDVKSDAVIICALYDEQNKFVKCNISLPVQITETEQTIDTEMTLPDNVTGYKLCAYIWDGLGSFHILYERD